MSKIGPILLLAILALAPLAGLARNPDPMDGNVPIPPPEPNEGEVTVSRGTPVWITLTAYSLTSPIIRFRIRRAPAGGKLGPPHFVPPDKAVVKYTPPAGTGPDEDSFSYQVQSYAGVSAPAEVKIHITDTDPVLIAPDELDFGEVLRGGTSSRVLVLQNIGGGLASGTVVAPEGWSVEGDPSYSVAAGAKQSFTLVFRPAEEKEYTGDIQYTGELQRATDLVGKMVAPISAPAGPVELAEAGAVRMGTIELANRTDAERTVRVTPGPSLDADPSIVVPPKGVADILVRTKPKENGAINDSVALEGDDFKAEIPVRGAPAPAMAQPLAAATPAPSPSASPVNGPQAAPAPEQQAQPAGESLPPMAPEVAAPEPPASPGTPVFSLVVGNVGENTARVTSDFKTAVPVHAWRLEAQTVGVNAAGMPEAQWQPVDNAALDVNGTKVSATLAHLRPNALYVVRLVGVDEQGRLIALSGPGHIWTPRAPERSYWGWVLLGAAAAAAAGTWRWWTRRPRWAGGL